MKSTVLLSAIAAAALGFSPLAAAQGPGRAGWGAERQDAQRELREARRDVREARRDLREARDDRRDARQDARRLAAREARFHRGGYLPHEYRQRHHVVHDWHARRLYAPPRGHQWVQVNGDYALVAVASGLIAQLLLGR
ncbi:RcnB family protein [Ramlibacter tataouinensis]|uniref:Candidate membrane protein n=1 Tax=Ramlibacter tataouinensis (strain ATCC BAA-407 / DSM 14655 / LMG 21543 / TTB310) TaxID=365046 RepID=F5Y520_RAMTT|nr:RcnB family protein [Ramlibacter tataouinensis]AEG93860.1 Conserved hypothetical protein [Ramlibacter tataouinensis TTB310]